MREFLFASIFSVKYEVKLLVESETSAGDVAVIQREGVKGPFGEREAWPGVLN